MKAIPFTIRDRGIRMSEVKSGARGEAVRVESVERHR